MKAFKLIYKRLCNNDELILLWILVLTLLLLPDRSIAQLIPACGNLPWNTTAIYSLDCDYYEHGNWVEVFSD